MDLVLESMAKDDVERRLRTMTTVAMTLAAERFGTEERHMSKTTEQLKSIASGKN